MLHYEQAKSMAFSSSAEHRQAGVMQHRDVALSSPATEFGEVSWEFISVLDFYLFFPGYF